MITGYGLIVGSQSVPRSWGRRSSGDQARYRQTGRAGRVGACLAPSSAMPPSAPKILTCSPGSAPCRQPAVLGVPHGVVRSSIAHGRSRDRIHEALAMPSPSTADSLGMARAEATMSLNTPACGRWPIGGALVGEPVAVASPRPRRGRPDAAETVIVSYQPPDADRRRSGPGPDAPSSSTSSGPTWSPASARPPTRWPGPTWWGRFENQRVAVVPGGQRHRRDRPR